MANRVAMLVAVVTLLSILAQEAAAQSQPVSHSFRWYELPSPWRDPHGCNRPRPSYICDPAQLLTQEQADSLDVVLAQIHDQTLCSNCKCRTSLQTGYTVYVAVIPRMWRAEGASNTSEAFLYDARLFSYWVSDGWRRANDCWATVFVLYLTEQNVLYTTTYRAARDRLSDRLVNRITVRTQERMTQSGSMVSGLRGMLEDYKDVFQDAYIEG